MRSLGRHRRRRTGWMPVLAPMLVFALGACDSLLEVDIPGNATAAALNDPQLASTLVAGVQGDFECGFVDYMVFPGQWFEEFTNVSNNRPDALANLRSALVGVYADPCDSGTGPVWTTMQLPRQQARLAIELLQGFPAGSITDSERTFLIAKARMYEAFSIQLLGEQFCGVTFDGGPLITPEATYDSAIAKFTAVIDQADTITGARAAAADSLVHASRIGRARARMLRGNNPAGVVADASAVPSGFQMLAQYETNPGRRRNRIHERMNRGDSEMPHRSYTDLRIDANGLHTIGTGVGTPDPRVVVTNAAFERRGVPYRLQNKYLNDGDDIPFATWREAQLMIAEVQQGQQAIDIINNLRSVTTGLPARINRNAWPLPPVTGDATTLTAAEIELLVREERRRELWMQGTQAGDKVRWGYPAWEAQDEFGATLGAGTCWPIPALEVGANPNL